MQFPNGRPASVHLAISDRTGDSAILEYVGGKLRIYHDARYTVMTNSPTFDKQMAIASYWDSVGGASFLPGGVRAADRFSRMRWMLHQVPKAADPRTAAAIVLSLVRAISVPLGLRDPALPNISSTRWRTVLDSGGKRLFFEAVYSPHIFWIDLDRLPLAPGASPLQLALFGTGDQGNPGDWTLSGEVSQSFKAAEPYPFLAPPH
jgi:choloylglycine hydrolase